MRLDHDTDPYGNDNQLWKGIMRVILEVFRVKNYRILAIIKPPLAKYSQCFLMPAKSMTMFLSWLRKSHSTSKKENTTIKNYKIIKILLENKLELGGFIEIFLTRFLEKY